MASRTTRPSWTPDGQSVLYILNRGSGVNTTQVWRKKADGSAPAESVYATSRSIVEATMSRDGQWLIYRINSDSGGADIYGVRLGQDTTPVPLLTGSFAEGNPALSPDGRWLAYVSNESGNPEVYVRPFPDVSRGRWQVSTGGGTAPRWAHSGRELFFVRNSDLMVAPVTTTAHAPSPPARRASSSAALAPSTSRGSSPTMTSASTTTASS